MKYEEFIKKVRERTRLPSNEEADRATKATLETLAERLTGDEAGDLASQLPDRLAMYMQPPYAGTNADFSLDEFFQRVSERERTDLADASFHARVVLGLLAESVSIGEIEDVRAQLPKDLAALLAVQNEGDLPGLGRTM